MLKQLVKKSLSAMGYEVKRIQRVYDKIPDRAFYTPFFSPWIGYGEFAEVYRQARKFTVVNADRCYILYSLGRQAARLGGEFVECGVYKGGTAMLLQFALEGSASNLHLFDTFEGMPDTDPERDLHVAGDFGDTSIDNVRARVPLAKINKGFIPHTFSALPTSIAFAHIDVDIYQSVKDCCEHIYPRMQHGGFMVFDDYGFPSCPGARQAVDEFFEAKDEVPLVLPTAQAIVFIK